ncbi:hypothetical protein AX16_002751 [Volvariella volvacea WC 439]|nr:hypothetical protein AX16_002751 [Volvariella volvacea WC 439]
MPDRNLSRGKKLWRKLTTSLFALLAPELIIVWAMRQRIWMDDDSWIFVQMGGFVYYDGKNYWVPTISGDGARNVHLGRFGEPWMRGIRMPIVSEEEIQDKAKGDFFSKLVAVVQTSWFVLQCVARQVEGLALTELELVTHAFAAVNIITYILWWDKPLNATYPIYFNQNGDRIPGPLRKDQLRERGWLSERYWGVSFTWPWEWCQDGSGKSILGRIKDGLTKRPVLVAIWEQLIRNPFVYCFYLTSELMFGDHIATESTLPTSVKLYYNGELHREGRVLVAYSSIFVGILFGSIHLIAWSFDFPTRVEQVVWMVSSVVVTAVPALFGLTLTLVSNLPSSWTVPEPQERTGTLLGWAILIGDLFLVSAGVGYALARVDVFVQAFTLLRDLPPSAYQNLNWSAYTSHI